MQKLHTQIAIVGLAFVGLVFLGASYYVEEQQADMVSKVKVEIVEQEKTLTNIAEITDRNGADAVVASIIKDCSQTNRDRFDTLLNRLGELSRAELEEIQSLFDACAGFFAERKAVMVARMEREFEVYRDLVDLLATVDDTISVSEYEVEKWRQLVELEQKRSGIFAEQVDIQQDIISALMRGEQVNSEGIQAQLVEARNINEEAQVLDQQIDQLRASLVDL